APEPTRCTLFPYTTLFRSDLGDSQSYGQYLSLDQILTAQRPVSFEHDEMLFIIIHQASELWMKLCLHELTAALDHIRRDDLGPSDRKSTRLNSSHVKFSYA